MTMSNAPLKSRNVCVRNLLIHSSIQFLIAIIRASLILWRSGTLIRALVFNKGNLINIIYDWFNALIYNTDTTSLVNEVL